MAAPEMMQFILDNVDNPGLVQLGITRDHAARAALVGGIQLYLLYDQGKAAVIQARAEHAAAQHAAVATLNEDTSAQVDAGTGTHFCSICQANKNDFARHNQEIHIKDPELAWFCPHCGHAVFRNSDIEYDVHLAGCRLDFRGRHGQDVVWQSTHLPDLMRFPKDVLMYLAQQNQPRIFDVRCARLLLRRKLASAGLLDGHPQLRDSRWPMQLDLNNPHIDLHSMTKTDLCAYIRNVRLQLHTFIGWFDLAQDALRIHRRTAQLATPSLGNGSGHL